MSLSWVTSTGSAAGPSRMAEDEIFTTFPKVTSELTSFAAMTGTLYLSTYRVVFIASPSATQVMDSVPLKQLSIPLQRWLNPKVGQPWFGPNFYDGEVKPAPGGGLQLGGGITLRAKFSFNEGGVEKFHKALEAAYATAQERHRNRSAGAAEEVLPLYESIGEGSGVPPTYT